MVSTTGLRAEDWFYYGEWQQPAASAAFWVHWLDEGIARDVNLSGLDGGFVILNGHSILSKNDFNGLSERAVNAARAKDAAFFGTLESVSHRIFNEALDLAANLAAREKASANKPSKDSKNGVLAEFEEFVRVEKRVMTPWLVTCVFSDALGEELAEQAIALGFNPAEIIARIPRKETLVLKQHREALAIKGKLEKTGLTPALRDEIDAHVREFEWLGTHHLWGTPFTTQDFFAELPKLEHPKPVEGELPKEIDFLARAAGDAGVIREYAAEVFNVAAFKARPLFKRVAAQLGITGEELLRLTPDETIALLRAGAKPERAPLEARKKWGFCIFKRGGREVVVTGEREMAELRALFLPGKPAELRELRGRGACPGKVRGAVRIFFVPEGFEKMRQGDVLVAPMTTPDFVPIMKRAAAIVTDNGGLLSHAAIVSRELGVPCVVGTRFATRALRDGDFVEVDGAAGVVKKV
jgi:phosphohistidine swiveling domain-containing protein/protein-disulfide isomerase-like protein with CxxC motif